MQQEKMQNYEQSQLPRADSLADESLAQAVPCSETNPTASAQLVTGCTKTTVGYLSTSTELNTTAMNRPAIQETNPAATGVMTFAKKDVRIHR